MNRLKLSSGFDIPQMGFGVFQIRDHEECKRNVLSALRNGYRHIDTAQLYRNEKAVGEAMQESGIPREEIFLTTKIAPANFGFKSTRKAIQNSLENLQVDYIDLMLLHQPFGNYIDAWKTLEVAVDDEKLRSIGVSNFNIEQVEEVISTAKVKPVINQVECHPYAQQVKLRSYLKSKDIHLEAWFPLGHGDKKLLSEPVFTELAEKYAKSNVQIILRWHIQMGNIIFPKSGNPKHIKSNINIFDFELSQEDMAKIAALNKNKLYYNIPDWVQKIMFKFIK